MLNMHDKITEPGNSSSEALQDEVQNPFENGPLTEEGFFALAYSHGLEDGNPLDTLHAIEQTPIKDKARELGALQDIARVYGEAIDRTDAAEVEEIIRDSTFKLIASKLSLQEVVELGLGDEYADDAGTARAFDFQELHRIAQSWDYIDRDPRIPAAVALLSTHFDDKTAHYVNDTFQLALEKGISFAQAHLDMQAPLNEMTIREARKRDVAGAAIAVCQVPMEKYDWLFDPQELAD